MAEEVMDCPFCGWKAVDGEYAMLLHMETLHAEGQSPFVPVDDPNGKVASASDSSPDPHAPGQGDEDRYVSCPVEGCGEFLLQEEMDYHIDLHAEEVDGDEHLNDQLQSTSKEGTTGYEEPTENRKALATTSRSGRADGKDHASDRRTERRRSRSHADEANSRQAKAIQAWKKLMHMPLSKRRTAAPEPEGGKNSKRLGKAQLGKYADEDSMPDWLVEHLNKGVMTKGEGLIPVLAQLLRQSMQTRYAYLCHPCTQHVSKLRKEGGFCGYRNIQTISSYMVHTSFPGSDRLNGEIPTIFQIQDFIESAWDHGINSSGREETGGIKGTRKYIGTPEALAMLRYLSIPCDAQGFKHQTPGKSEMLLMEDIENYFQQDVQDPRQKVRQTNMPPIYFQHAGHSMTIIGLERQKGGQKNLLVFDPMFHDSKAVLKLVGTQFEARFPDKALSSYRRGPRYLKRYREFEILKLRVPSEDFLANS